MKHIRLKKFVAAVLSLVIMASATIGLAAADAAATEGEPTGVTRVGIAAVNINYAARLEMVYAVRAENLDESATVYLLFFNSNPEADGVLSAEELYRSAYYRRTAADESQIVNGDECLIFTSRGIAAKNAAAPLYVCPVIRYSGEVDDETGLCSYTYERGYTRRTGDEGAYTYEYSAREGSVKSYANEKLGDSDNTPAQINLYEKLIAYVDAVAGRFN